MFESALDGNDPFVISGGGTLSPVDNGVLVSVTQSGSVDIMFNKEKEELKPQLEMQEELKHTNAILENATNEIKNLKATDIAVIKNMHKPPRGVVLVIMAL